jgi:acyl-CoA synthetase (AMP-forming)/AMP-acid ligase II
VALGEKFEKRIGGAIAEGYSLTEATMSSTKNYANKSGIRKFGSVGIPLPFTELKIVDAETGTTEMAPGEEGELIQKGPSVALGYLNKPEDTREAFRDEWLLPEIWARWTRRLFWSFSNYSKDAVHILRSSGVFSLVGSK